MSGDKGEAQQRVNRIQVFRRELAELEREGALALAPEQRAALERHHQGLLASLAERYDVDITAAQRQISWGMRIASTLGGLALCAALVFFFYRIWGLLGTPAQVAALAAAPVLALGATELAARREKTLYYAGLASLVAFAAFVMNLSILAAIFQITPSRQGWLAWGLFAMVLAYTYGLRLPLLAGLVCLAVYAAASATAGAGASWLSFGERPENFLPAGLAMVATPAVVKHRRHPEFAVIYRAGGLLLVFTAILILSQAGGASYLPGPSKAVEVSYQMAGFAGASLAIWAGIRRGLPEAVNLGAVFFVIFLYAKFVNWWWDWMPKYLFFLVVGVISLAMLALFRRLRAR